MDKPSTICKMCYKYNTINVGNVCDQCHSAVAKAKGTPQSFELRSCRDGMYCLRCKYVVDHSRVNTGYKYKQSYCSPCRSIFMRSSYMKRKEREKILKVPKKAPTGTATKNPIRISKSAPIRIPKSVPTGNVAKIPIRISRKIEPTRPQFKPIRMRPFTANESLRFLTAMTNLLIEDVEMDIAANLLISINHA